MAGTSVKGKVQKDCTVLSSDEETVCQEVYSLDKISSLLSEMGAVDLRGIGTDEKKFLMNLRALQKEINRFPSLRDILRLLQQSRNFQNMMVSLLSVDCLTEISRKQKVYAALLDFIELMASDHDLCKLLPLSFCDWCPKTDTNIRQEGTSTRLKRQPKLAGQCSFPSQVIKNEQDTGSISSSVLKLMDSLSFQAQTYLKIVQRSTHAEDDESAESMLFFCSRLTAMHEKIRKGVEKRSRNSVMVIEDEVACKPNRKRQAKQSSEMSLSQDQVTERDVAEEDRTYATAVKHLQFCTVDMVDRFQVAAIENLYDARRGKFARNHSPAKVSVQGRMKRIITEIASLPGSLPISSSSSIFVRVDETRPDLIKAIITGPEDTPYANGCFEFDVLLPSEYPNVPPLVKHLTVTGTHEKFNPNLYEDGTVCLSLLGTWDRLTWIPDSSTVLQVLVSIQGLVFVKKPYFNEPGLPECPSTTRSSHMYSRMVEYHTLDKAICNQILKPPQDFREVVLQHFKTKKEAILKQLHAFEEQQEEVQDQTKKRRHFEHDFDGVRTIAHLLCFSAALLFSRYFPPLFFFLFLSSSFTSPFDSFHHSPTPVLVASLSSTCLFQASFPDCLS
eukprot:747873-Hanusia_phi.AAC.5